MKNKFPTTLCIVLFISTGTIFSQTFEVPVDYHLDTKKDYALYEEDVISCISWLEETPLTEEPDKRKEASTFLITWINGSPTVTIEIHNYVIDLTNKNIDLLVIYMGGWTKYAMENPDDKEVLHAHQAALKALVTFYSSNIEKGIKKDKNVEKLTALSDPSLNSWINEQLAKEK